MTSLVAIRCTDGVVVGADGSATFGDSQFRTIEQTYDKKIQIISGSIIVACTGYVGHAQRFGAAVENAWKSKKFSGKSALDFAKELANVGISDFRQTQLNKIELTSLVAYQAENKPQLCELPGSLGFQPEVKENDGLWFTTAGSGQSITDPFVALFKSVFWKEGPPSLQGGIFTTLWALKHACEVNPGGIKEPIKIAVLQRKSNQFEASFLTEEELLEHGNMVEAATKHMREFKEILLGNTKGNKIPTMVS